jgi:hypothetical protein
MTSLKIKVAGTEYTFECVGLSQAIAILTEFYPQENQVESFEVA